MDMEYTNELTWMGWVGVWRDVICMVPATNGGFGDG